MNVDQLNRWLTLLANVGVIAGIVFLGAELQQNNDLLTAQARAVRVQIQTDFLGDMEQEATAELVAKAWRQEELTDAEEARVFWLGTRVLVAWEYVYGEYEEGMIAESALPADLWRTTFEEHIPRMCQTWERERTGASHSFVRWMEENVVNC